jgi:hypothetical protein
VSAPKALATSRRRLSRDVPVTMILAASACLDAMRQQVPAGPDLMDEVSTADLVVMVATPGGHAQAASIIGEARTSDA